VLPLHCSGEPSKTATAARALNGEYGANRCDICKLAARRCAALRCLRSLLLLLLLRYRCARSHPDDGVHKNDLDP